MFKLTEEQKNNPAKVGNISFLSKLAVGLIRSEIVSGEGNTFEGNEISLMGLFMKNPTKIPSEKHRKNLSKHIYNYLKTFGDISKENNWQSGNGKLTLEKVNKIRDDILEKGSLPKALITGVNSAYKIELSAKGKTSTTGSKTKVKKTTRKSIK